MVEKAVVLPRIDDMSQVDWWAFPRAVNDTTMMILKNHHRYLFFKSVTLIITAIRKKVGSRPGRWGRGPPALVPSLATLVGP